MSDDIERTVASAGSHGDARWDSFKEFVLEWTGRSLEQHQAAGTTGLEFASACWLRGGRLTDEEREAVTVACGDSSQWGRPHVATLMRLLERLG
jgi:hypothetical protein